MLNSGIKGPQPTRGKPNLQLVALSLDEKQAFLKNHERYCELLYGPREAEPSARKKVLQFDVTALLSAHVAPPLIEREPVEGWDNFVLIFRYPWMEAFRMEADFVQRMNADYRRTLLKSVDENSRAGKRGMDYFVNRADVAHMNFGDTIELRGQQLQARVLRAPVLHWLLHMNEFSVTTVTPRRTMLVRLHAHYHRVSVLSN